MNLGLYSIQATRGLLSDSTQYNHTLLKGAALLYSKVLLWTGKDTVSNIVEVVGQNLTDKQKQNLRSFLISIEEHDEPWSKTPPTEFQLLEELREWASVGVGGISTEGLEAFTEEHFNNYLDACMSAGEALDKPFSEADLEKYKIKKQKLQELLDPPLALYLSILYDTPYHGDSVEASKLVKVLKKPETEVSSIKELKVSLPNLYDIPFETILELRENPFISNYRWFIKNHIVSGTNAKQMKDEINEAFWDALGESVPSPTGSFFTRAVSQITLPFFIPNPLNVAREIKNGIKERKLYTNYGWLYFIQEARKY